MKLINKARRRIGFRSQYRHFVSLNQTERPEFSADWTDRWARLDDDTGHLPFDAHYVYHTAWAARVVAQLSPSKHIDISSYTYFSTLLSAFVPVEFYDYRPAEITLSNLKCGAADLCDLEFSDRSVESLSCMHTIEHIGLGRYGDPMDANGDKRALAELERVLAPRGSLLVVVPVGKPRIQFNAHRIYDPQMLEDYLPNLKLAQWTLLPDDTSRGLVDNPSREFALQQRYGCGCFWFQRP
jgi:SAM-dependent methyltransferase